MDSVDSWRWWLAEAETLRLGRVQRCNIAVKVSEGDIRSDDVDKLQRWKRLVMHL